MLLLSHRWAIYAPGRACLLSSGRDVAGYMQGESEDGECIVCWQAPRQVVAVPCGHFSLCAACASDVCSRQPALCPVCRKAVDSTVRVAGYLGARLTLQGLCVCVCHEQGHLQAVLSRDHLAAC